MYFAECFIICWNKAAASQVFSINFILFLFSDYCWEIVNILIYTTIYSKIMPWTMEQKIFCVKTYYETKSSKIVQARYRRKLNFNIFLNRSLIFKLVKNFEAHGICEDHMATGSSPSGSLLTIQTPRRNVRTLSISLHTTFNGGFTWIVNIWSIYARVPLSIFGSGLKLNDYKS